MNEYRRRYFDQAVSNLSESIDTVKCKVADDKKAIVNRQYIT